MYFRLMNSKKRILVAPLNWGLGHATRCIPIINSLLQHNFKVIISPGIFEIPVIIARNIKYYDAFVALGCVIKGKTPHFDLISKAATNGIMDLAINYKKPIGNGIISCFNKKQAYKRSS